MINGSLGGALSLNFPRTELQDRRLPLTQTALRLPTFLETHQPHPPDKIPLLFGPTGGPTSDPGLLLPGADLTGGEGTEDNPSKQNPHPTGMGKPRGPSSRRHHGPWPTAQVPSPPDPSSVYLPPIPQSSPPRQPAEEYFLSSPIG